MHNAFKLDFSITMLTAEIYQLQPTAIERLALLIPGNDLLLGDLVAMFN